MAGPDPAIHLDNGLAMTDILGWIVFGALTGWVASKIVNKRGEGCITNTALGLVGAMAGGFLFRQFGTFD